MKVVCISYRAVNICDTVSLEEAGERVADG